MYFITTICVSNDDFSTRTVGYYFDREEAIARVKENYLDIWETIYEYVVIQKFGEGFYPDWDEEIWFEFDEQTMKYVEIEFAPMFKNYHPIGIG